MRALDFSFCLGRWSIKETDVVKLESPAQLSERVGILGKEDGVIIDVDLQGTPVGQEGGRQEIKVGEQEFPCINFGGNKEAAAIVEHVEHGKIQRAWRKPTVGSGVQLPEFSDLGSLPATHWGSQAFEGSRMRTAIVNSPAANLGTIKLKGMQSQGFRGDETVRAGRGAKQTFFEEVNDRIRPSGGMIAAGDSRNPHPRFLLAVGAQVIGRE